MASIRLAIDDILEEKGINQRELAEGIGLSRQSVSRLANRPKQIRIETLESIAQYTGWGIDQILVVDREPEITQ